MAVEEVPKELEKNFQLLDINREDLKIIYEAFVKAYGNNVKLVASADNISNDIEITGEEGANDIEGLKSKNGKNGKPAKYDRIVIARRYKAGGQEDAELVLAYNKAKLTISNISDDQMFSLFNRVKDQLDKKLRWYNPLYNTVGLIIIAVIAFMVSMYPIYTKQATPTESLIITYLFPLVFFGVWYLGRHQEFNTQHVNFILMDKKPTILESIWASKKDIGLVILGAIAGAIASRLI